MEKITKCLNEWNATIEALGQGIQTILIRKYGTSLDKFILYPTVSYVNNDDFLDSFQEKYRSFAEKNALPKIEGNKSEVKYFAEVEKIIERPSSRIGILKGNFCWSSQHVRSYLGGNKAYVWILRVYELKQPIMAERTKGIQYSNLLEPVSLDGIKPVINDNNFAKIVEEMENKR